MKGKLPAATHIQFAHLRVADVNRICTFYAGELGLRVVGERENRAALSATGRPPVLLQLTEDRHAPPRPPNVPGLFHIAIRFANRGMLASAVLKLLRRGYPLQGAADHAVSEAIYLADPEGNGVELYADRPRTLWRPRGGGVVMVTEYLDLNGLLAEAERVDASEVDMGIDIGHVHLSVSDLAKAQQFYAATLGFDVTTRSYPGALFLAAGGYHHHIGLNTWYSRGRSKNHTDSLGLIAFGIAVPESGWSDVRERIVASSVTILEQSPSSLLLQDNDGIGVELRRVPDSP